VGGHEGRRALNLVGGSYRWGRACEEGERGGRKATGAGGREIAAAASKVCKIKGLEQCTAYVNCVQCETFILFLKLVRILSTTSCKC
jgi:hypothetical protein